MATKKHPPPQPGTDRYLCPGPLAGTFGVKRHVIAGALRQAGRTQPITVAEARRWRDHPEQAPQEGLAVLAAVAAAKAEREHRQQQADLERAHRMMILREKVEQRLLRGAKHFRSSDAELIARDIAFRASKELVRGCGRACGGRVDGLRPVELAALRWAGIDPDDHSTWVVHRGDCQG